MRVFLRYCLIGCLLFLIAGTVAAQGGEVVNNTAQQLQGVAGELQQRIQLAAQDSVLQLVLIIGGAAMLLIGWRIYNFVIMLAGVLTGALVAVALIGSQSLIVNIIVMLIGGAIGGVLAVFLYYIAVFAIGAYFGVLLTLQVLSAFTISVDPTFATVVGGIMGGLIMLALSFELLVVIASIVGGQLLALGLGLGGWWIPAFIGFGVLWQITLAKITGYKVRRRPTRRLLFRDT